jgi:hypothetical protein
MYLEPTHVRSVVAAPGLGPEPAPQSAMRLGGRTFVYGHPADVLPGAWASSAPLGQPPSGVSRKLGAREGAGQPRAQTDRQGRWPSDGARRSRTARRLSGSAGATGWRGCYVA